MTRPPKLRIATRTSRLALWQTNHVAELLHRIAPEQAVEIVKLSTHGDRDRSEALSQIGGQGLFTREVQEAVLDGRADLAVHSLKDLPTAETDGLTLGGVPQRASRFDVLVLPTDHVGSIAAADDLPQAARIGTGSPRRRAQLLHHRADLDMADIRGNVETRLRKLDEGACDAIVLAEAGLERLGLDAGRRLVPLRPPLMLPAVGQAALGVECRTDDTATLALLAAITDATTLVEVTAERACLRALQAGCHAPVGTLAEIAGDLLTLRTVVLSVDGRTRIDEQDTAEISEAEELGRRLAARLLDHGAGELIAVT